MYTPQKLYDIYKDSILEEINAYSALLFGVFKKVDLEFTEDHLLVTLEDTVIAHGYEEELHDILDKIFCERCGQNLIIHFAYKEPVESKYRENSQILIDNKIAEITRQNRMRQQQKELLNAEENEQDQSAGKVQLVSEKMGEPRKRLQKVGARRGGFAAKKSSNQMLYMDENLKMNRFQFRKSPVKLEKLPYVVRLSVLIRERYETNARFDVCDH